MENLLDVRVLLSGPLLPIWAPPFRDHIMSTWPRVCFGVTGLNLCEILEFSFREKVLGAPSVRLLSWQVVPLNTEHLIAFHRLLDHILNGDLV
jgi:hypothetical protein